MIDGFAEASRAIPLAREARIPEAILKHATEKSEELKASNKKDDVGGKLVTLQKASDFALLYGLATGTSEGNEGLDDVEDGLDVMKTRYRGSN